MDSLQTERSSNADIQILLLDDDVELLGIQADVLQDAGYRVTAAATSQRAVEVSLEQDFDLVITDIRMAGLDGLEALARVRQVQPEVRSLVVTGYSNESNTLRALRLGVSEYLTKPFRAEQLLESVERLVVQVREQRLHSRLELSLRKLLIWSLERFASDEEIRRKCDWITSAGRTARQLALALQLGEGGGESIQLACLCTIFQGIELPDFVVETLPKRVQAILSAQQGLENSVIQASQELAQGRSLDDSFAPKIRHAHERLKAGLTSTAEPVALQRRTTLSLAVALEAGEQLEAAVKAYQTLLVPPPARESVTAAYNLARLSHRMGKPSQARGYAVQAVEISRNLGPLSLAAAACDAGILLSTAGAPEAEGILVEASELNGKLGFSGRKAQARLALSALKKEAIDIQSLGVLLESRFQDDLVQSVWWLAPLVLNAYAEVTFMGQEWAMLRKSLQSMLREKPAAMLEMLSLGRLSPQARLALVELNPSLQTLEMLVQDEDAQVRKLASEKISAGFVRKQPPILRIISLGRQEVCFGEELVSEEVFRKNQKARHMLTYLALDRGRQVSGEILEETFWPEGGNKRKNLHSIRSILRKALRPPGFPEDVEYVVKSVVGLMMNPELDWWHDLEELRRCLRTWEVLEKSQRQSEAMAPLRRAAQLYRGPFLENCYSDWAIAIREQTEYQMVQALLRLAQLVLDLHLSQGGIERSESILCSEAQEVCQRVLEIDPCSQEAYRLGMLAFIESGRSHDALRLYERCVKLLKREIQAEPSIPVFEMYTRARLQV